MLHRRKAPTLRSRAGICTLAVATLAACTRERPAEPAPPQLSTVHRFVEQGSRIADDARLTHGSHVFLGTDARPVLTAARPYVPGLLCESTDGPHKFCRAKRPADLPAAPHAIFARGSASSVKHPDLHDGPPAPDGAATVAATAAAEDANLAPGATPAAADAAPPPRFARSVLLPPGEETPVGWLMALQHLLARTYAIPALEERQIATGPFTVPPGALLRLSIGVEEPVWWVDSAPVLFRVVLEDDSGAQQDLYRRILDPAHNPADRRWYDSDVDLTDLAGRTIRLRFTTEPVQTGDTRPSLPLWGDPRVLAPPGSGRRPSVVLVSLDTLRARSMSLYGHALETTPNITRLAARGTTFDNAFTTFSNTLPSHMSMLTGLLPATHAVFGPPDVLGEDRTLLAEQLRRAGYATAAFTEDALLDSRRGFRRGFSTYYENTASGAGAGDAGHTFGRALEWAGRHADEPFFLFVHTYQVHFPYDPPPAYRTLFTGPDAASPVDGQRAYEQEVRYTDDLLQRLVDGLRRILPDEELLLVVTADHGKEFFEHGLLTHNQLFDEVMHVPLVIVWPGHVPAGRRVAELVSLIDVTPTILQLVGAPVPPGLDGLSLAPLLAAPAGTLSRDTVFGEYPWTAMVPEQHFVARSREAKCIVTESGAKDACFDLRADPGERDPRSPRETREFERLHDAARAYGARSRAASIAAADARAAERAGPAVAAPAGPPPADQPVPDPPDENIARKMRALGYVQ